MTDSHAGYLVVLEEDVREDDAEWILNAIRMIKRVKSVQPLPSSYDQVIARDRRDHKWQDALFALMDKMRKEEK